MPSIKILRFLCGLISIHLASAISTKVLQTPHGLKRCGVPCIAGPIAVWRRVPQYSAILGRTETPRLTKTDVNSAKRPFENRLHPYRPTSRVNLRTRSPVLEELRALGLLRPREKASLSQPSGVSTSTKPVDKPLAIPVQSIRFYLQDFIPELQELSEVVAHNSECAFPDTEYRTGSVRLGDKAIINVSQNCKKLLTKGKAGPKPGHKIEINDRILDSNPNFVGSQERIIGHDRVMFHPALGVFYEHIPEDTSAEYLYMKGFSPTRNNDVHVIQYMPVDTIQSVLESQSEKIVQALAETNDDRQLIPINFVYKQKFCLPTTFHRSENKFMMEDLKTLFQKGKEIRYDGQLYGTLVSAKTRIHPLVSFTKESYFTSSNDAFLNTFAVFLKPCATVPSTSNIKRTEIKDHPGWTMDVVTP